MKRTMEKRLLSIAISISLIFGSMLSAPMQASAATAKRTIANVIIFVEFSDTKYDTSGKHAGHEASSHGQCFMDNSQAVKSVPYAKSLFDGDASHPIALKQYLNTISYGQLQVENVFPQISGDKITPYRLAHPAAYYTNTNAGDDGDQKMIKELIESNAIKLPSGVKVDYDGDNAIDNLTIIATTDKDADAHKSTYKSNGSIGGYAVKDYNMLPEYSIFMMKAVGVACHEFLHTVGYPDLYRENAVSNGRPVGEWDIMASAGRYLQYPLAYLRGGMTNWFTIPTIGQSTQQYSLYAASKTTIDTKDQQAVILKTSYSDSEFFVLEYRKQAKTADEYESTNLIQASGLIIYRVNTRYSQNYYSSGDMIYVFRPGDSYNADGREKALNYVSTGALASELGRTSYGSSDPNATLMDGAITYSDGTNSGIVISNVGSNAGNQITFDITYHAVDEYWTTVAELDNDPTYEMASYMDTDGTIYSLQRKGMGISPVALYQYNAAGWKKLGEPLRNVSSDFVLGKYNGNLYAGCVNTSTWGFKLFRWNGSGWAEVFSSPENTCLSNTFTMTSAEDGIYFSYLNDENCSLTAYRYTTSGVTKLGDIVEQGTKDTYGMSSIGNVSMTAEHGKVAIGYKDTTKNQIIVKMFNNNKNIWETVGNSNLSGEGVVKLHKNQIYLMRSESSSTNGGELYRYNLSAADGTWNRIGPGAFSEESAFEKDICFIGDVPYVAMIGGASQHGKVMNLVDGQWGMLGNKITNEKINNLQIFSKGNDLYAMYCTSGNKVYIKSHVAKEIIITPDENPGDSGGNDGTTGGNPGNTGGDSDGTGGTGGTTGGNTGNTGGSGGTTGGNTGNTGNTGGSGGTTGGNTGNTGNTGGSGGTTGGNTGNTGGSGGTTGGNTGNTGGTGGTTGGNTGNTGGTGGTTGSNPGSSGGSEDNTGTTPESPEVPKPPVNTSDIKDLTVKMLRSNSLRLSWNYVPNVKSYEVYYSTSPDSGFKRLTTTKKTFYDFKKAKCGQTYYFQVRTTSKLGKQKVYSDFCPAVSGRTVLNGTVNAYISKSTYNSITIKWDRVKDAKKYEIYYATSPDGEYHFLKSQGGRSFTHKGLTTGGTYYYQVRPVRDLYKGEFSNEVSAKAALSALTKLRVTPSGMGQIKLSWRKVPGAKSYVILRADSEEGPYEQVGVTYKSTYVDAGLPDATGYYYKVYGVSGPYKTNVEGPVWQMTKAAKK